MVDEELYKKYKIYRREYSPADALAKIKELTKESSKFTLEDIIPKVIVAAVALYLYSIKNNEKFWIQSKHGGKAYAFQYLQALRICRKYNWHIVDTVSKAEVPKYIKLSKIQVIKRLFINQELYCKKTIKL